MDPLSGLGSVEAGVDLTGPPKHGMGLALFGFNNETFVGLGFDEDRRRVTGMDDVCVGADFLKSISAIRMGCSRWRGGGFGRVVFDHAVGNRVGEVEAETR